MKLVSIPFASVLSAAQAAHYYCSHIGFRLTVFFFTDSEDSSDREEQEEREAELRREAYEDGREDQADYDEEYYED